MAKRSKSSGSYMIENDLESSPTLTPLNKTPYSSVTHRADHRSDFLNICLLMLLYVLQGIPLGLAGSIPMILQQRDVSYKDQAMFSLSFWPFSIKLLWAPIVDACYWRWMGRRKSWMVPSQYIIGFLMLILSSNVNRMLGEGSGGTPHVTILTISFFLLNFLAATQDIAVDGWALTMLSRANIGWASTCNSVGQTTGYFLGFVVFLALESKDFCVNYLGQTDSLVTLPGFFFFWGIVFIITTTLVWVLKTEINETADGDEFDLGLVGTYKVLYTLLRTPAVKSMIVILLTVKVGFAAADSLTALKLTEAGVPKDRLALLSIPLTPVQIFLPLYISKYTVGPRPLDTFLKAYMPRLFMGVIFAWLVWVTPYFKDAEGQFPNYFYGIILLVYITHQIAANCMFVSIMAFYALISDSKVGGTYMTLLNTFTNLGGNWPAWLALRCVSELTWKTCMGVPILSSCNLPDDLKTCGEEGGVCITTMDGYYIESLVFIVIGVLWFQFGAPVLRKLQSLPKEAWSIKTD